MSMLWLLGRHLQRCLLLQLLLLLRLELLLSGHLLEYCLLRLLLVLRCHREECGTVKTHHILCRYHLDQTSPLQAQDQLPQLILIEAA